jgi:hypothetical protein
MEGHPLLYFLSPPRERIRGEGVLSSEREKGGGGLVIEGVDEIFSLW